MIWRYPENYLQGVPCCVVAVACALGRMPETTPVMKPNGYTTLAEANRYIRAHLPVKKRVDYKRGERPRLYDLNLDGRAIVCVEGHFVFVDKETFWSFFYNEFDDVIAVWLLKGENA